jgi:uncharacterized pyridoxamine 5'-phosphate oxidase family protein
MHESEQDLRELQDLLDRSYARAGEHLRSIFTEDTRIPAHELPALLKGVQVLHLGTVTAACEPRVAPVDGLFFEGRFWFGSSPTSGRFRNIGERPQVSAAVTRGEEFAVIVHGSARGVDTASAEGRGFREYCLAVYGPSWEEWGAPASYARIDPTTMFAYLRPQR